MLRKRGLAGLAVAAMTMAGLPACGEDADSATATGTTATTAAEPSEVAVLEEEIAEEGGSVETGDWRIAYIKEPAEGWFQMDQGHLVWRDPAAGETAHLEIIPIERETGRIVPDARITLEVLDAGGERVEKKRSASTTPSSSTTPRTSAYRTTASTRSGLRCRRRNSGGMATKARGRRSWTTPRSNSRKSMIDVDA